MGIRLDDWTDRSLERSIPPHSSTAKRTSIGLYPLWESPPAPRIPVSTLRGVNEGRSGELLEASELLDILEVFGEDGMRSYLVGVVQGQEDAAEDEQDAEN